MRRLTGGQHVVAVTQLPDMGTDQAAIRATLLLQDCPNVTHILMVGIAGAVAETVGGQAHLIDPHDEVGWRDAMLRVCTDDDWWRSLREGAEEVAKPFTWERCANETLAAYRRALGPHSEQHQGSAVRVGSGAPVVVD